MVKQEIIKFFKHWSPAILWAAMIFYLSSVPGLNSGLDVFWDVFLRKLVHAGEFGILALLIFAALRRGYGVGFKKSLIWTFALTVLYAVSDELHQYFVPMREARAKDVGVDSLGVAFASALILLAHRLKWIK